MTARFSPQVEAELRAAGWFEGRRIDISTWDTFPMRPFAAAREVLVEFGDLRIGHMGPGIDCARSDVDLTPTSPDRSFIGHGESGGQSLYPLGAIFGGNGDLMIKETGTVHLLWDGKKTYVARSFDVALERLLLGKQLGGS